MNFRLLSRLLGIVAMLIGGAMVFSIPFASPVLSNQRYGDAPVAEFGFEWTGFWALLVSTVVAFGVGSLLIRLGGKAEGKLYRKEAMAVVGLSWIIATVLGALPYVLGGVYRSSSVRAVDDSPQMQLYDFGGVVWQHWINVDVPQEKRGVVLILNEAGARGLSREQLADLTQQPQPELLLEELADESDAWAEVLIFPGEEPGAAADRVDNYRIRWVRMGVVDSLFEAQSGFSTTGATVISDLEDPVIAPKCILFWRSSTHFLGGLGIIVLFVVILGQGSAGKALMRAEMPGPTKEGATARMQHTAWLFAVTYCALNIVLAALLWLLGLKPFDALCHAFGTMATGGFSTYNASVGHFQNVPQVNAPAVEYTVVVFMILAGTNFTLLSLLLLRHWGKLLGDPEWRVYLLVIFGVSALVVAYGLWHRDFVPDDKAGEAITAGEISDGVRYSLFQVVSIITTTGFGTHDFDKWNSFGRGVLFLMMFVGGCAGSTAGGLKVIRHMLFLKIMRLEVEHAFRPRVVRPLRMGGKPVDDPELRRSILVYFCLILVIFVFSWMFVVTVEPDTTWGSSKEQHQHKLIDSASGVAATLNNIGPGLGTVGATENYAKFSPLTKLLFIWLMMIGRLEIFSILVLFVPSFWRNR
jgi:trk system potassium uptake protein TrkH